MISFYNIPATARIPGVGAEVDPSLANTSGVNQRSLILAQMLTTATPTPSALPNFPILGASQTQVNLAVGAASQAALMYAYVKSIDPFGECWVLPVADNPAGVAGTMTVTITGQATEVRTLALYVNGSAQDVLVNTGDLPATIAANIVTAINDGNPILAVVASAAGGVVTVTSRHKGASASDMRISLNYYGPAAGEQTPAGITVAIAQGVVGQTDPIIDTALSNLGTTQFDFVFTAFSQPTQNISLQNLFSDVNGRWSWQSELFGGAFNAYSGTAGAVQTYGTANNNQHLNTIGMTPDCPEPAYIWAAGYGATAAASLKVDPAVPLQYLPMPMLPPPVSSRFSQSVRQTFLYSGISTWIVNDAGQVELERSCSNYQVNSAGAPDNSYLNTETLYTLQYLIRDLRTDLLTKFMHKKLFADGTRLNYNSNGVTSQTVLLEAVANYRKNATAGYCQNPDQFAAQATAENQGNGRVAMSLPFMLANQLRRIDFVAQFTKP